MSSNLLFSNLRQMCRSWEDHSQLYYYHSQMQSDKKAIKPERADGCTAKPPNLCNFVQRMDCRWLSRHMDAPMPTALALCGGRVGASRCTESHPMALHAINGHATTGAPAAPPQSEGSVLLPNNIHPVNRLERPTGVSRLSIDGMYAIARGEGPLARHIAGAG